MTETPAIARKEASIALANAAGLHARPAVKLAQLAKGFAASLEIATNAEGPWTDAKSLVKLMRLKAAKGVLVHFRSAGSDSEAAIAAALDLVARKFDED
jgi:phosphocarrier protein HPr